MARRKPMRVKKDKAVFARTASKTKAINVKPLPMRGGIRL